MADRLFISSEALAKYRATSHLSQVTTRSISLAFKAHAYRFEILISKSPGIVPSGWRKAPTSCRCCGRDKWDRGEFDNDFRDTADLLSAIKISRESLVGISIAPLITTCYCIVSDEWREFIGYLNDEVQFVPISVE